MSLSTLEPGNTKRAKSTSVNAFMRFIQSEGVSLEYVKGCIERDEMGKTFIALMDRFGMHLAFSAGKNGKALARHSVMQYYRQVKNWLLDEFPQHRAVIDGRLLKMGRTLEKYCLKRETGGFVKKATACSKEDLKLMMSYVYAKATSGSDYQDATLLCLLWYLFGRASDLSLVNKQNVSISAGNVLFVRFIRMKTSEEQALSLFPDNDYETCPVLAIALTLMMQTAPGVPLLGHLPSLSAVPATQVSRSIPLLEILDHPDALKLEESASTGTDTSPGIHNYVNRLLDRIAKPAGVDSQLTSHSFRRGGAQFANGSAQLSAQWIFDRGAWNLTTTNKAYAYVFNTPSEDQKVSKILSGWDVNDTVTVADFSQLDSQTQSKLEGVRNQVFSTCQNLQTSHYNVNRHTLDVLTTYLIRHYPSMKDSNPNSPVVKRFETAVELAGCTLSDVLSWSSFLNTAQVDKKKEEEDTTGTMAVIKHQNAVIEQLIEQNKRLEERMSTMEEKLSDPTQTFATKKRQIKATEEIVTEQKKKKHKAATHLMGTWYEWYTKEPRIWSSNNDRQRKSDMKMIVAYLKLFLNDGFSLDVNATDYRDRVVEQGQLAEANVIEYLRGERINAKGSSAVLKHVRKLHRQGKLNDRILQYRRLLNAGKIVDPSPIYTQDILDPISNA